MLRKEIICACKVRGLGRAEAFDLVDLLAEVSEFLDNYVDVVDGAYGEPAPNRAMSLKQRVDELLDGPAY